MIPVLDAEILDQAAQRAHYHVSDLRRATLMQPATARATIRLVMGRLAQRVSVADLTMMLVLWSHLELTRQEDVPSYSDLRAWAESLPERIRQRVEVQR